MNTNLMQRLSALINTSPILEKAFSDLCTACEKNPEVANKLMKCVGDFTINLTKVYVRNIIQKIDHANDFR